MLQCGQVIDYDEDYKSALRESISIDSLDWSIKRIIEPSLQIIVKGGKKNFEALKLIK